MTLEALLHDVRACRLCAHELDPRPVLALAVTSRVLLVGQAPGAKVHASGRPWDDASGDHLREWLDVDRPTFDDVGKFGMMPMGFCYPGRGTAGDLPPPRRCAETWHPPLLEQLAGPPLILLIGALAQRRYLPATAPGSLTEVVRSFRDFGPRFFPLPHPAWRSRLWVRQNPWFADEVLPALRTRVQAALAPPDAT